MRETGLLFGRSFLPRPRTEMMGGAGSMRKIWIGSLRNWRMLPKPPLRKSAVESRRLSRQTQETSVHCHTSPSAHSPKRHLILNNVKNILSVLGRRTQMETRRSSSSHLAWGRSINGSVSPYTTIYFPRISLRYYKRWTSWLQRERLRKGRFGD